jgi:prepilin-type N-terminal cleavage/methylation domain-containing protein
MNARAYTLIEIVVVLLILAVVSAVAVPAFSRLVAHDAGDVARDVASAYRTARQAAVTRGSPATAALDLRTGAYVVFTGRSADRPADTLAAGVVRGNPAVRLSGGRDGWAWATFGPLGDARATPLMIEDGARRYELTVDPWTSAIDVRRR